mmetsp:Transcript_14586/g.33939  ORF Transcript_14586/g.33939 Transcript_14586/m.33939 type:complete len:337 (+) Transcript_14586:1749-2759(+)
MVVLPVSRRRRMPVRWRMVAVEAASVLEGTVVVAAASVVRRRRIAVMTAVVGSTSVVRGIGRRWVGRAVGNLRRIVMLGIKGRLGHHRRAGPVRCGVAPRTVSVIAVSLGRRIRSLGSPHTVASYTGRRRPAAGSTVHWRRRGVMVGGRARLGRIPTAAVVPGSERRVVGRPSRMIRVVSLAAVMRGMVILVIRRDHVEVLRAPSTGWRILHVRTVLGCWRCTGIRRSVPVLLVEGSRIGIRDGLVGMLSVVPVRRTRMRVGRRWRVSPVPTVGTRPRRGWMSRPGSYRMWSSEHVLILAGTRRRIDHARFTASLENHFHALVVVIADLAHLIIVL